MDNAFNPYQEWLGIDPSKHSPTYFELFGLAEDVSDLSTINSAADAALSRVRACRPGDKARQWASLLDELDRAKLTLLDGGKRAAYLQQVQSGQLPGQQQQQENTVQPEMPRNLPRNRTLPLRDLFRIRLGKHSQNQ